MAPMNGLLLAVAALTLQAPEKIWKVTVEVPAGWARHDAGGLVRLAPKGMPQPEGVLFFPPDTDLDARGWLGAVARQLGVFPPAASSPPCPYPVALCVSGQRQWPGGKRTAAVVAWVLTPPQKPGSRPDIRLQAALVQVFDKPPSDFEAKAAALLASAKVVTRDPYSSQEEGDPSVSMRPFGTDHLPVGLAGIWAATNDPRLKVQWTIYPSGAYDITSEAPSGRWTLDGDRVVFVEDGGGRGARRLQYRLTLTAQGPALSNLEAPGETLVRIGDPIRLQPVTTQEMHRKNQLEAEAGQVDK